MSLQDLDSRCSDKNLEGVLSLLERAGKKAMVVIDSLKNLAINSTLLIHGGYNEPCLERISYDVKELGMLCKGHVEEIHRLIAMIDNMADETSMLLDTLSDLRATLLSLAEMGEYILSKR